MPVDLKLYPAVWDCGQLIKEDNNSLSSLATNYSTVRAILESRHQMPQAKSSERPQSSGLGA